MSSERIELPAWGGVYLCNRDHAWKYESRSYVRKYRGNMGWDTTRWYQIFIIMFTSTDLLLPRPKIMKKSLTCLNVPGWLMTPLFLWVILILITFWMRLSTNPIHYIETAYAMHQFIDEPTWLDDKTSSVLDVILKSHPVLHRKCAVLKYTPFFKSNRIFLQCRKVGFKFKTSICKFASCIMRCFATTR